MSNQKNPNATPAQQRQPCHYQMPLGVLPLGQDLLPRQTMNNIVAALCQKGLLTGAPPAVKAGKRPTCSPPPGRHIRPNTWPR